MVKHDSTKVFVLLTDYDAFRKAGQDSLEQYIKRFATEEERWQFATELPLHCIPFFWTEEDTA